MICVLFMLYALVVLCCDSRKVTSQMEQIEAYMAENKDRFTRGNVIELNRRKEIIAVCSHLMTFCVLVNILAFLGLATRQGLTIRPDCSELYYGRYVAW